MPDSDSTDPSTDPVADGRGDSIQPSSPARVAARLKLSAGVKPATVVDNLVRSGHSPEVAAEAVALEVAARAAPTTKAFQPIHTRKSLIDRYVDSSKPLLIGLGITALGAGLFFGTIVYMRLAVRVFLAIMIFGIAVTLYGFITLGRE